MAKAISVQSVMVDKLLDNITTLKESNNKLRLLLEKKPLETIKEKIVYKEEQTDSDLRFDKDYDYRDDDRWSKTIAIFDKLWHWDETGPDGCGKCERYQKILYNAFNKVESLSGRTLEEFTTATRDKDNKVVKGKDFDEMSEECDDWYHRFDKLDNMPLKSVMWQRFKRRLKHYKYVLKGIHKYRIRIIRK